MLTNGSFCGIIKEDKEIRLVHEMREDKGKFALENEVTKDWLIDNSIMVSDNIAILGKLTSDKNAIITTVSMKRPECKALFQLTPVKTQYTNMSASLLKRSIAALNRNRNLIMMILEEEESETEGIK